MQPQITATEPLEVIEMTRERYKIHGCLSEQEIEELLMYEFSITQSLSLKDQLRKYLLRVKDNNPEYARKMQTDLERLVNKAALGKEDIRAICFTLSDYLGGFAIRHDGHSYTTFNGRLVAASEFRKNTYWLSDRAKSKKTNKPNF